MTEEVLFQITKEHLDTGLRGFPVGYCTTSTVDPQKGLFYGTYPVSEVDEWEPEKVIFLLYAGHEGLFKKLKPLKKSSNRERLYHAKR